MAKLTEAQKLANKEVAKKRNAEYRARYKLYADALEQATLKGDSSPEAAAFAAASEASEAALRARDAAIGEIDAQIQALEQRKKELRAEHEVLTAAASARRREANDQLSRVRSALKAEVQAQFPDMDLASLASSVAWEARCKALAASKP